MDKIFFLYAIVLMFLLSTHFKSYSQFNIANSNYNSYSSVMESIHIHLDKDIYQPGETVWYKAYLMEGSKLSITATNFYTELITPAGKVLLQNNTPIFESTTCGSFIIPDTLTDKLLFIRAFTENLALNDSDYIYIRAIHLIQKDTVNKSEKVIMLNPVLQFFPEAGTLLEGTDNVVAFKLQFQNDIAATVKGKIKTVAGDSVTNFSSLHNAMGTIIFTPEKGKTYYAEWADEKKNIETAKLPTTISSGIGLHIEILNGYIYYIIKNTAVGDAFDTLHITALLQGQTIYNANINMTENVFSVNGKIKADTLPTGVLVFILYNKYWQPIVERAVFVNNNNYSFNVKINILAKNLGKRGENIIELNVPDSFATNMSISITDSEAIENEGYKNNIISQLLLASQTNEHIYNPQGYFKRENNNLKQQLDILMLSTKWHISNNFTNNSNLSYFQRQNKYIQLQWLHNDNTKPTSESLNILLQQNNGKKGIYNINSNADGNYELENLIFFDSATIHYKVNGKKANSDGISISTNKPLSINTNSIIKKWVAFYSVHYCDTTLANKKKIAQAYFAPKGKILQSVVVNSKKKIRETEIDNKYTSGMFSGGANTISLDVLNDPLADSYYDIYSYITSKIPRISKRTDGSGRIFFIDTRPPHLEIKNIFMDEHPYGAELLQNLSIEKIAYVKFIPVYFGSGGENQFGPAIAIYTRKWDDIFINDREINNGMVTKKVMGYPEQKEFYSPDYSQSGEENFGSDLRTTIYWNPYIITNPENKKVIIKFYNNDFCQKLKVVLEGINEKGKMIHIEKIIE